MITSQFRRLNWRAFLTAFLGFIIVRFVHVMVLNYPLQSLKVDIVVGIVLLWPFLFPQQLRKHLLRLLKLSPLFALALLILFHPPLPLNANWIYDHLIDNLLTIVIAYLFAQWYSLIIAFVLFIHFYRSRFAPGSEFFGGAILAVLTMMWEYGWGTYFPLVG